MMFYQRKVGLPAHVWCSSASLFAGGAYSQSWVCLAALLPILCPVFALPVPKWIEIMCVLFVPE